MSKAEHETGPQGVLVCPVCKQPVTAVVKRRHKSLGIFVPVWRPGPCHNPDCPEYLEAPAAAPTPAPAPAPAPAPEQPDHQDT